MAENEQTELLREMCDLLRVMAEPALAKRDEKRRATLLEIVGRSQPKAKAVQLMDGFRTPKEIHKASGLDQGDLSRLLKVLRAKELLPSDEKHPKLLLSIPPNFFEKTEKQNG